MRSPDLIVHCDWSMHPTRRWQAKANLDPGSPPKAPGHYTAQNPEPVGPLETYLSRVASQRGANKSALVGFDFPIGLPIHYAQAAKIASFVDFLQELENDSKWASFYTVAKHQEEISIHRPFYPHGPGNKRQSHLLTALAANDLDQLRRLCEQAQPNRRAANPLFWTLGASQAGKGAIVGWRDLIAPALAKQKARLWPFQGTLPDLLQPDLLQPNTTVLAETYPTQYHHALLGESLVGKGKTKTRKKFASQLEKWAGEHAATLTPELTQTIREGCPQGDDAFDAILGLFGMIQLAQTYDPLRHEPVSDQTRNLEGWILGQPTL